MGDGLWTSRHAFPELEPVGVPLELHALFAAPAVERFGALHCRGAVFWGLKERPLDCSGVPHTHSLRKGSTC